jgi:thioesterase domain-containing protein
VTLIDTGLPDREDAADGDVRAWFAAELAGAGVDPAALGDQYDARYAAFAANIRAFLAHRPEPYAGRLAYLSAERDGDADRWRDLAPTGFVHHTVGGDHYTVLRPPYADTVARILDDLLTER